MTELYNAIIAILGAIGAHYIRIDTDVTVKRIKRDSNLIMVNDEPIMFGKWLEKYIESLLSVYGYASHDKAWNNGNDGVLYLDGMYRYIEVKSWMFSLYDQYAPTREDAITTYFVGSTANVYIYGALDSLDRVVLYVMTPAMFEELVWAKGLYKPAEGKIRWRMVDKKFDALIHDLSCN